MIIHTKLLDYFALCVKNNRAKIRVKVVSIFWSLNNEKYKYFIKHLNTWYIILLNNLPYYSN